MLHLVVHSGAKVNEEAANGRTPLHEASVVGDSEMVELLIDTKGGRCSHQRWQWIYTISTCLQEGTQRCMQWSSYYQSIYLFVVFTYNLQVMEILLQYIPTVAHPYDLLGFTSLSSCQTITTLVFQDSKLISGSKDCNVRTLWSVQLVSAHILSQANGVHSWLLCIGFSAQSSGPHDVRKYPSPQYCAGSRCLESLSGCWINHSANIWLKEGATNPGWKCVCKHSNM